MKKQLRLHNTNYEQLGKKSGYSATHLRKLSKGERHNPGINLVQDIAECFGVSVEHILKE